ncbi:hypothetical protein M426DRAFT_187450 [Hypoxylon sp. CI-4A]|nr:hypothetical protein M426DRAFT_187450 [Hypoxylon sp. CI-4A]
MMKGGGEKKLHTYLLTLGTVRAWMHASHLYMQTKTNISETNFHGHQMGNNQLRCLATTTTAATTATVLLHAYIYTHM